MSFTLLYPVNFCLGVLSTVIVILVIVIVFVVLLMLMNRKTKGKLYTRLKVR